MRELKKWETEHKELLQPPPVAWGTIILFITALTLLISNSLLFIKFEYSILWAILLNTISLFALFTVMHDASHRSLSKYKLVNELLGTISAYLLTPVAGLKVFRFIHMQHHRFTNGDSEYDPDSWCSIGSSWTLVFRCMTLDLYYLYWYRLKWQARPLKERGEILIALTLTIIIFSILLWFGYGWQLLILWLVPTRLAILWLGLAFDYLPHYPHDTASSDSEYLATNIRPNKSYLMTPLLLSQNYHLIHHLYPRVPFYRYGKIWHIAQHQLKLAGVRCYSWGNKLIE